MSMLTFSTQKNGESNSQGLVPKGYNELPYGGNKLISPIKLGEGGGGPSLQHRPRSYNPQIRVGFLSVYFLFHRYLFSTRIFVKS